MRFLLGMLLLVTTAHADSSWWGNATVRACCDKADALYADEWESVGDNVRVKVTGGGPLDHSWAPIGRVYVVPQSKVKHDAGNPTGHAILFVSPYSFEPYCFFTGPLI